MGNCVISLWGMQTGFQLSEASLKTMLCISGFGISLAISFSTTENSSSFSGASSRQEYWADQEKITRLLVACAVGLLVDGCKSVQMCAKRAARGGCDSSTARGFSGTCAPIDKVADALVLRSLGAVPGVWRLPVWEQADDINAECFSLLGSWSYQTRIPQRIHDQLYGIHQVRALPVEWAALEVPLKAAVRNGDVLLADDREGNKAWCVDRRELFLYLTSQLLQDKHT